MASSPSPSRPCGYGRRSISHQRYNPLVECAPSHVGSNAKRNILIMKEYSIRITSYPPRRWPVFLPCSSSLLSQGELICTCSGLRHRDAAVLVRLSVVETTCLIVSCLTHSVTTVESPGDVTKTSHQRIKMCAAGSVWKDLRVRVSSVSTLPLTISHEGNPVLS